MSSQTRISQVYDVFGEEIACVELVYNTVAQIACNRGFIKIQTAPFEEHDRYLGATKVHFSKIFEVVRPKQRSVFLLKSDLAMSMSRFVADLPNSNTMTYKLIQMDDLCRDRIPNLPGYRKNFKQILLGIWGTSSLHADAELISTSVEMFSHFNCFEDVYIQISNQNIFNVLGEDVAGKVRFGDISVIETLLEEENDYDILRELFSKPRISFEELIEFSKSISNSQIIEEINRSVTLYEILKEVFHISMPIYFSLSNLGGTNHYSGMNYRVYASCKGQEYLLVDGGRIDSLVKCFNESQNIPGVCMGVGVQVMAQLMKNNVEKKKKVHIVLEDSADISKMHEITQLINILNASSISKEYEFSILQCRKFNIRSFFSSEFYNDSVAIIITPNGFNVRSNNSRDEVIIKKELNNYSF